MAGGGRCHHPLGVRAIASASRAGWRAVALAALLAACSSRAGGGGAEIPRGGGSGGPGAGPAGSGAPGAPDGGSSGGGPAGTEPDGGTPATHPPDALGTTPAACPPRFDALPDGDAPPAPVVDADAGSALTATWEIRPPPGRVLVFDGVVDESGNVYWKELPLDSSTGVTGETAELVSATRDGAIRFRAPVPSGPMLLAGVLLVTTPPLAGACSATSCAVLEAHRADDGSFVWRRDLTPDLEPWMRTPGDARYAALSGIAASSGQLLVGASLLDAVTLEHESGYVALDAATGAIAWTARTSSEGNVAMSGAPVFAEDGTGYGSRTFSYLHDDLLRFPGGGPPVPLSADASTWHGGVLAAYGALLVTEAVDTGQASGMPSGIEVRCRDDGSTLAPAGTVRGRPLLGGSSVWFFTDGVSRHDAGSGSLLWSVKPLPAPPVASPPPTYRNAAPCASPPLLTSDGSILFVDQQGLRGASSAEQALGTPVLHGVDLEGRESLRRALPLETECYEGALALHGGRVFVGGQITPSTGAHGVVRAFDLPAAGAPAARGWIGPGGSQQRDRRAR